MLPHSQSKLLVVLFIAAGATALDTQKMDIRASPFPFQPSETVSSPAVSRRVSPVHVADGPDTGVPKKITKNDAENLVMAEKDPSKGGYGTCKKRPSSHADKLLWGVDPDLVDRIACKTRHEAEVDHYFNTLEPTREFFDPETHKPAPGTVYTFYDSVSGKPLFRVPKSDVWYGWGEGHKGFQFAKFARETDSHGWPSFRDGDVVAANVLELPPNFEGINPNTHAKYGGEIVSVDGTHLGHNIPDKRGNRYCIDLVSIAGSPDLDKFLGHAADADIKE